MPATPSLDDLHRNAAEFLTRRHGFLVNGEWVDGADPEFIKILDPSTGEAVAQVQAATAADVDRAVRAASHAFHHGPWPQLPPSERARQLLRLADAVEQAGAEIAYLEMLDHGMPFAAATRAVGIAIANLRYFAGWCGKLAGRVHSLDTVDIHAFTVKEPVGVVGAITPWNFPFVMAVAKLSQALAAGCTVVLKPAELTPLTALRLAELIRQVDFPKGVVNVAVGYGNVAGKALVEHPDVDKISFTGSTATGKWIVGAAASSLKRVTLELGGKSPTIIFPDADLDKAIPGAAMAVFANAGQVCVAGSRLFVHKDVFKQVVDGVAAFADALVVGSGLDPRSQIGPLASQGQFDRVAGYIASGVAEGAAIRAGGHRTGERGYFMRPTVLADVRASMRVAREEIFGPVVCASQFDDDDLDAIAGRANDTDYGLAAYIWTRDVSRIHRLARKIRAGSIQVNGGVSLDPGLPFGGFKQSGWGREQGGEGVEAYLETKSVAIRL